MAALTFDALLRGLKREGGALQPVYYLHGEEDVLKEEAVRALLDRAVEPAMRDFNVDIRAAGELDAETLHALVNTPPLLVLVQGSGAAEPEADLAARAAAVAVGRLAPERVPGWIAHRGGRLDLTLAPDAVDLLIAAVGPDLGALAQELDKLGALAAGRTATA